MCTSTKKGARRPRFEAVQQEGNANEARPTRAYSSCRPAPQGRPQARFSRKGNSVGQGDFDSRRATAESARVLPAAIIDRRNLFAPHSQQYSERLNGFYVCADPLARTEDHHAGLSAIWCPFEE